FNSGSIIKDHLKRAETSSTLAYSSSRLLLAVELVLFHPLPTAAPILAHFLAKITSI
ncbi:hypothetical protein PanWU01x14_338420, partial [Parasponia andersonii]